MQYEREYREKKQQKTTYDKIIQNLPAQNLLSIYEELRWSYTEGATSTILDTIRHQIKVPVSRMSYTSIETVGQRDSAGHKCYQISVIAPWLLSRT